MKKIISSKLDLFLNIYASLLFFVFSIMGLLLGLFGTDHEKHVGFLLFAFFLFLTVLLVWTVNRTACIVWVENDTVKCKGLISGFYKECPVRQIQSVRIKFMHHELGFKSFVYLVTDSTYEYKKFYRRRKDGYICFKKTKKNLEFLRTFWSGSIIE